MADPTLTQTIEAYCQQHALTCPSTQSLDTLYKPLADHITQWQHNKPLIVGISGSPGSGKSVLAMWLQLILQHQGQNTVSLSIDDFYLTKKERKALATTTHPFLRHRGVPGTHDLGLALNTITQLQQLNKETTLALPRFDKSHDDRADTTTWPTVTGPIDIILLEGWCLGATSQTPDALADPLNDMETTGDPDGLWRDYVNTQIEHYQPLFQLIDKHLYIQVKNFEHVVKNRLQQEHSITQHNAHYRPCTEETMRVFLQLFQRLSEHLAHSMPTTADVLLTVDQNRHYTWLKYNT